MSITHAQDRLEVIQDDQPGNRHDAYDAPEAAPRTLGARPTFTITEAAAACAVSRKTITRKLVDLAAHGAAKDDDGIWRIPVEALLALGLHPGRSMPTRSASPAPSSSPGSSGSPARMPVATPGAGSVSAGPDIVSIPRDRWDDLRIRLARAEAEAAERALALADARLALRALTAGPAPGPATAPSIPQEAALAGSVDASPGRPQAVAGGEPGLAPAAAPVADRPMDEIASARSHAARTGGYVPAGGQPVRKRRWWQAK